MMPSRGFESPNLVLVTLAGVVTPGDQARLVEWVRDAIRTAGPMRLLVLLERFAGWNPGASFENPALWLRDDEGVTRIAIVGEPQWKLKVLTVIAQPLRRIPIEYFETEAAARLWLDAADKAATHTMST